MTAPTPGISRTSQATALGRSRLERPYTPEGDPDAQRALCHGMEPLSPSPTTSAGRGAALMAFRTRFFDEHVLGAIAAGITQIVICGAGYDDRGLRFRHSGVSFFELDLPETQSDKARRLQAMGADTQRLTLAPADLRADDVADILDRCGLDADRPTLFICEGLLAFFDERDIVRFLAALSSRAAPGSILAATLEIHRSELDTGQVVAAANAGNRIANEAEPVYTILPLDAHLALLEEAGWRVDTNPHDEAAMDHPDLGRTQLVTAMV